ncbi:MAG: type II toxin-antitoxin system Phd/YefM family antitoxin [Candidatus Margulisbacteria bacterium]|jgi:PHD/YefM family antitoxin component YafN of YafNO toxin-antitoxin module|nr:type II toxin-antitoxin system Phd/YefM family antitoxin [Candidatus Margulisiibacteriota bacterium]
MFDIQSADIKTDYAELAGMLKEHDQIILTNSGKNEAVLINFEDYAEIKEYLRRKYLNSKLDEAEAAAAKPETRRLEHEEFWDAVS